jgi:hypothetical protein
LSPFLPVSERGNQGTEQISPANLQALNNGNGKLLQTKHEVHLLIPEQLTKLVFGFTPGHVTSRPGRPGRVVPKQWQALMTELLV